MSIEKVQTLILKIRELERQYMPAIGSQNSEQSDPAISKAEIRRQLRSALCEAQTSFEEAVESAAIQEVDREALLTTLVPSTSGDVQLLLDGLDDAIAQGESVRLKSLRDLLQHFVAQLEAIGASTNRDAEVAWKLGAFLGRAMSIVEELIKEVNSLSNSCAAEPVKVDPELRTLSDKNDECTSVGVSQSGLSMHETLELDVEGLGTEDTMSEQKENVQQHGHHSEAFLQLIKGKASVNFKDIEELFAVDEQEARVKAISMLKLQFFDGRRSMSHADYPGCYILLTHIDGGILDLSAIFELKGKWCLPLGRAWLKEFVRNHEQLTFDELAAWLGMKEDKFKLRLKNEAIINWSRPQELKLVKLTHWSKIKFGKFIDSLIDLVPESANLVTNTTGIVAKDEVTTGQETPSSMTQIPFKRNEVVETEDSSLTTVTLDIVPSTLPPQMMDSSDGLSFIENRDRLAQAALEAFISERPVQSYLLLAEASAKGYNPSRPSALPLWRYALRIQDISLLDDAFIELSNADSYAFDALLWGLLYSRQWHFCQQHFVSLLESFTIDSRLLCAAQTAEEWIIFLREYETSVESSIESMGQSDSSDQSAMLLALNQFETCFTKGSQHSCDFELGRRLLEHWFPTSKQGGFYNIRRLVRNLTESSGSNERTSRDRVELESFAQMTRLVDAFLDDECRQIAQWYTLHDRKITKPSRRTFTNIVHDISRSVRSVLAAHDCGLQETPAGIPAQKAAVNLARKWKSRLSGLKEEATLVDRTDKWTSNALSRFAQVVEQIVVGALSMNGVSAIIHGPDHCKVLSQVLPPSTRTESGALSFRFVEGIHLLPVTLKYFLHDEGLRTSALNEIARFNVDRAPELDLQRSLDEFLQTGDRTALLFILDAAKTEVSNEQRLSVEASLSEWELKLRRIAQDIIESWTLLSDSPDIARPVAFKIIGEDVQEYQSVVKQRFMDVALDRGETYQQLSDRLQSVMSCLLEGHAKLEKRLLECIDERSGQLRNEEIVTLGNAVRTRRYHYVVDRLQNLAGGEGVKREEGLCEHIPEEMPNRPKMIESSFEERTGTINVLADVLRKKNDSNHRHLINIWDELRLDAEEREAREGLLYELSTQWPQQNVMEGIAKLRTNRNIDSDEVRKMLDRYETKWSNLLRILGTRFGWTFVDDSGKELRNPALVPLWPGRVDQHILCQRVQIQAKRFIDRDFVLLLFNRHMGWLQWEKITDAITNGSFNGCLPIIVFPGPESVWQRSWPRGKDYRNACVITDTTIAHLLLFAPARSDVASISDHMRRQLLRQIDRKLVNPFRKSAEVKGSMFFDRAEEVEQLDWESNDPPYYLFAGRLTGKTSLTYELERVMHDPKRGRIVFRLPFTRVRYDSEHGPFTVHKAEIVKSLVDNVRKRNPDLADQLGLLDINTPDDLHRLFLRALKEDGELRFFLIVDEADSFVRCLISDGGQREDMEFGWRLRDLANAFPKRFRVLFIGWHDLSRIGNKSSGPFGNIHGCRKTLSVFDLRSASELLQRPMAQVGVYFHNDAVIEELYQMTGGHPATLQHFGKELLDWKLKYVEDNSSVLVTLEDVRLLYDRLIGPDSDTPLRDLALAAFDHSSRSDIAFHALVKIQIEEAPDPFAGSPIATSRIYDELRTRVMLDESTLRSEIQLGLGELCDLHLAREVKRGFRVEERWLRALDLHKFYLSALDESIRQFSPPENQKVRRGLFEVKSESGTNEYRMSPLTSDQEQVLNSAHDRHLVVVGMPHSGRSFVKQLLVKHDFSSHVVNSAEDIEGFATDDSTVHAESKRVCTALLDLRHCTEPKAFNALRELVLGDSEESRRLRLVLTCGSDFLYNFAPYWSMIENRFGILTVGRWNSGEVERWLEWVHGKHVERSALSNLMRVTGGVPHVLVNFADRFQTVETIGTSVKLSTIEEFESDLRNMKSPLNIGLRSVLCNEDPIAFRVLSLLRPEQSSLVELWPMECDCMEWVFEALGRIEGDDTANMRSAAWQILRLQEYWTPFGFHEGLTSPLAPFDAILWGEE
jgi:hypothetical protein